MLKFSVNASSNSARFVWDNSKRTFWFVCELATSLKFENVFLNFSPAIASIMTACTINDKSNVTADGSLKLSLPTMQARINAFSSVVALSQSYKKFGVE